MPSGGGEILLVVDPVPPIVMDANSTPIIKPMRTIASRISTSVSPLSLWVGFRIVDLAIIDQYGFPGRRRRPGKNRRVALRYFYPAVRRVSPAVVRTPPAPRVITHFGEVAASW